MLPTSVYERVGWAALVASAMQYSSAVLAVPTFPFGLVPHFVYCCCCCCRCCCFAAGAGAAAVALLMPLCLALCSQPARVLLQTG
jgi:hypothetical protein